MFVGVDFNIVPLPSGRLGVKVLSKGKQDSDIPDDHMPVDVGTICHMEIMAGEEYLPTLDKNGKALSR